MKILIIGGTAFMGPFLVKELSSKGHVVTVFHRGNTPLKNRGICSEILGNRYELGQFKEVLRKEQFEVVIDMISLNEQHSQTVVDIFNGSAKRHIVISSMDVYRAYDIMRGADRGPVEPIPITEESALRQKYYPYKGMGNRYDDYDKILVERAAMAQASLPTTCLRMPMIYGPGDLQHRFYPYLQQMCDDRPHIVLDRKYANWRWTRGYVEDCAHAISLVAERENDEHAIYNVAETDTSSIKEWLLDIAAYLNWGGELITVDSERLPENLRVDAPFQQDLVVSSDKIRHACGFKELRTKDEAFRRTIEWERKNPPPTVKKVREAYRMEDEFLNGLSIS